MKSEKILKAEDRMLPYKIIAKWNGLEKQVPEDDENMIWINTHGDKYLLTPMGFVSVLQENVRLANQRLLIEVNSLGSDIKALKQKISDQQEDKPLPDAVDLVGRKTKSTIKSVLGSRLTDAEKVHQINQYLKFGR